MNLADWHARSESVPLTGNQLGRIHREFARLGFDEHADRARRLAATAALCGLDQLDSSRSLSMAQAGLVIRALGLARDRSGLDALLAAEPEPEPGQVTVEMVDDMLARLHAARGWEYAITLQASAHTIWQAEIRITPAPGRDDGPDRSYVSYRCHGDPHQAVADAAIDILRWVTGLPPAAACPDCAEPRLPGSSGFRPSSPRPALAFSRDDSEPA